MNADMGPMRPRYLLALARFLLKTRINPGTMQKRWSLVSNDPPRHDVMRKIVNRAFTPKRIEAWEQRAREIVATRLAKLARGDAFDVVEDLAVPLPVTIIAEMLGVAPEGLVPLLAECEPGQSVAPFVDSFLVRGRTQLPLGASRAV